MYRLNLAKIFYSSFDVEWITVYSLFSSVFGFFQHFVEIVNPPKKHLLRSTTLAVPWYSSTQLFCSFNKPFVLFSSSSVLFNLSSALLNLIQSKARWVLVADSRWCSISWRWTYMKIYTSFTRNYTYLKLSPYLKQLIWFKVLFDNGFTGSSTNSSESFLLVIFPRTFD